MRMLRRDYSKIPLPTAHPRSFLKLFPVLHLAQKKKPQKADFRQEKTSDEAKKY